MLAKPVGKAVLLVLAASIVAACAASDDPEASAVQEDQQVSETAEQEQEAPPLDEDTLLLEFGELLAESSLTGGDALERMLTVTAAEEFDPMCAPRWAHALLDTTEDPPVTVGLADSGVTVGTVAVPAEIQLGRAVHLGGECEGRLPQPNRSGDDSLAASSNSDAPSAPDQAEASGDPEQRSESAAQPESEADTGPEPEPAADPEPQPAPTPEPEADAEPEPEVEPEPEAERDAPPTHPRLTGFRQASCNYNQQFDKMSLTIEFQLDSWTDWRVDTHRSNFADSRVDATQWHRGNPGGSAVFDVTIENYRSHHPSVRIPLRPLHLQHANNRDTAVIDPGQETLRADLCRGWPPR